MVGIEFIAAKNTACKQQNNGRIQGLYETQTQV